MMKSTIALLLITLLSGTVVALDVDEKPTEFYVTTGLAIPAHDFQTTYNYGFNGSLGVGFRLANNVRVVTKVEVQTFSFDHSLYADTVTGGDYTALLTGVDLRLFKNVPGWYFDPSFIVGGGVAYSAVTALTIGTIYYSARDETKFYFNIGVGVDFRLTPQFAGFVTARYVRIAVSGPDTEFYPITVGMRF